MGNYSDKLRDPRWQKKRLEVLTRDEWKCRHCKSSVDNLQVHHHKYTGEPWEAPMEDLMTLCESCHQFESSYRKKIEENLVLTFRRVGLSAYELSDLDEAFQIAPQEYIMPADDTVDIPEIIAYLFNNTELQKIVIDYIAEEQKEVQKMREALLSKIRK